MIDNCKEEMLKQLQRQLNYLGLKIKKGMIQDATFIHSDPGHAKADKPLEVKQKQGETGMEHGKKGIKSHF